MKGKTELDKKLNIRITSPLHKAMVECAASVGELPAVFARKAIINRLTEEGHMQFTECDADPWHKDSAKSV